MCIKTSAFSGDNLKMKIQIISRKFIRPSDPTPAQLRNYKLSCIDQLSAPAYMSFIFYYPCGNGTISGKDLRQSRLENSLSEVLTQFYPFAGRYREDLKAVDCCDEGAEYLEAEVDCRLDEFLQGKPDTKLLNQFIPYPDEFPLTTTVLAVQINRFDCSGLVIGICLSHKVADGFPMFSFINEWATACRTGIRKVKPLSFELQSVLPARDVKMFDVPVPKDTARKIVTKRFTFDADAISSFKDKCNVVSSDGLGVSKLHPSRVEVVTLLAWKAQIALNQAKSGHLRPSILIFLLNLRGKTALQVPTNVFGNFCELVLAHFRPDDTTLEFSSLLTLIRKAKITAEESAKTRDGQDLCESRISTIKKIHEELSEGKTDICMLTSVCRFPYYEADFGWGKPSWVSIAHKPSEIIHLLDTKCGRGIEAFITLEENDMLQFQKDEDIAALTSNTQ